jgi:hypothetical protein
MTWQYWVLVVSLIVGIRRRTNGIVATSGGTNVI